LPFSSSVLQSGLAVFYNREIPTTFFFTVQLNDFVKRFDLQIAEYALVIPNLNNSFKGNYLKCSRNFITQKRIYT